MSTVILIDVVICAGCSRHDYRGWADRDAYRLMKSREVDPLWQIPDRTVEPNPESRLADIYNPDCEPIPPDDPSANCYMQYPYRSKPIRYWNQLSETDVIDSGSWMDYLPVNDEGKIELTKQRSVDLALLNSRDFQDQVESLYLSALSLSQNRFEFALNWFGGSSTNFDANDDGADANRLLSHSNQLGFTRNLAAGGQFAVDLANSFVWQLGGGPNSYSSSGNLLIRLTQPLLRGAFQFVRTESLTQSERQLLYEVREFARFRRQFYLDVVSEYLGLLNQEQGIRINEENLISLRLNLEEHEELLARDLVSPIQVDQVFQSYQEGRLRLINSKQSLESSLDQFKFQLGLPARVPFEVDETILDQFQLNSPELTELRAEADELQQSMMKYLPPEKAPREFFDYTYEQLEKMLASVEEIRPEVESEYEQWLVRLKENEPAESASEDDRIEYQQQANYAKNIKQILTDLDERLKETRVKIAAAKEALEKGPQEEQQQLDPIESDIDEQIRKASEPEKGSFEEQAWKTLQGLISQGLQDAIGSLFVAQTQIRLFAIEIKPIDIEAESAVQYALENRLDLKNARAQVVDAYRAVEIAANALKSGLSVSASADLRTDPTKDNPIAFDGDENRYNFGLQFDGPLNRFSERNAYRAAQIAFQRQRRAFMATEDAITNQIRQDLRDLVTNRFNFQISRQSLVTATRQVDEAQLNLRTGGGQGVGDSSLTQDLLNALNGLRNARNGVILSWVAYEISRIRLFVDLELLMLDADGVWINEQENSLPYQTSSSRFGDADRLEFEQIFNGSSENGDILDNGDGAERTPESSLPLEPEPAAESDARD